MINDFRDLGNEAKVTWLELGLRLNLMNPCTKFGETSSIIYSDIERKPF